MRKFALMFSLLPTKVDIDDHNVMRQLISYKNPWLWLKKQVKIVLKLLIQGEKL